MNTNDTINRVKYLMSGYNFESITKTGELNTFPGVQIQLKENQKKIAETYLVDITVAKNLEANVVSLTESNLISNEKCIYLYGFEIEEIYRGNGYGNKLLKECLNTAYDFGYNRISLMVLSENTIARNLYTKNGFRYVTEVNNNLYLEKLL